MDVDDLCETDIVNEEQVKDILKERYLNDQIYTYIGDILLYVNPYKKLEKHDSNELYSVMCKRVLEHIPKTQTSQCFVVMGESGSGKTEVVNSLVKKVLSMCNHFYQSSLIEKISKVDLILQPFGTAQTSLNDQSTRFGKYLQICFSPNLSVVKAHVSEYFLESSRVASTTADVQNFYIFLLMFAGRTDEELSNHLLESPTQHWYLNYGEGFSEDLISWSRKYNIFIDALRHVGFFPEEITSIFGVLSSILNLGDIIFGSEADVGVFIENLECLDKVAILLGVNADDLEIWLTCNAKSLSDEFVSSFKNIAQATAFRDSLVISLYTRLFGWVVNRINFYLELDQKKNPDGGDLKSVSVGFFDIFGFENLYKNNLEQLFINTTNEQIQFYFTQHIFAWEQLEYEQEGIEAKMIPFICNKEIINLLLEKPNGIFALLEEESTCLQADDNTLLSKFNAYCYTNKSFISIKEKDPQFAIIHYAQKVRYSTDGFLQKNINHLDGHIIQGLQDSTDALISTLFTSTISKSGQLLYKLGSAKQYRFQGDLQKQLEKKKKHRIEQQHKFGTNKASRIKLKKHLTGIKEVKSSNSAALFRSSLVNLMEKILVSDAHFVRCIKPNNLKLSNKFDDNLVMEQVKYMDLIDTIRIRQNGYPYRVTFQQFLERYEYISCKIPLEITPSNCIAILQSCNLKDWKIGKTKVFLKLFHVSFLSKKLDEILHKVVLIQKVFRGYLTRMSINTIRTNVNVLQNSGNDKSKEYIGNLSSSSLPKHPGKENALQKNKLTKVNSDYNTLQMKETLRRETLKNEANDSINRKVTRSKSRAAQEPIIRNFTSSSVSGWCRVDCYERQHHVATFRMDEPVICIDGIHPVSDKHRISFAGLPTRSEDLKVLKVKSCIGKGVQLHQDERQNLWATRLGKNPIFVRGHTLCPELVKLNGKLTQGVPMKVLDTSAFKEYMKKECETSGLVDDELRDKIMSRLKVCMSFIKDTVVDEETPCWFEVWLIKVNETVNKYLDNYKKKKDQKEEKRMSGNFTNSPLMKARIPPIRRAKSGDTLKTTERRVRSQSGINEKLQSSKIETKPLHTEDPINKKEKTLERVSNTTSINNSDKLSSQNTLRREKSLDVRLEQRLLSQNNIKENINTIEKNKINADNVSALDHEQSLIRKNTGKIDISLTNKIVRNSDKQGDINQSTLTSNSSLNPPETKPYQTPTDGMSYRQVFGLQTSDYLFYVTPPSNVHRRRFSDSDTESMQNFALRSVPQDDGRNKLLQNIQPKKWIKKVRRKSEDNPKRKLTLTTSNK
ncbi:unconventional myosin-IXb isoform X1 [Hydra vulgaris]|uniref:unconventional myosin-IXb isoform X1 n=1 Tax=Hydra vulgaris TaxID=6087 RepID=UPI001F5FA1C6|nr:unconventional myosin-IXb-like [Hydra vulgaris]